MSKRLGTLLASVSLLTAVGVQAGTPEAAVARAPDRTCGTLPGKGYYNYIEVWGVSCRYGRKISRKAGRKFCGQNFQRCSGEPGDFFSGRVRVRRYRCKMRVGWEFYRARCRKNADNRFVHRSAA